MTLKRFVLWCGVLLLFGGALAAEESPCNSRDIAMIDGLIPGMNGKEILSLGEALSVETMTGEDDGGYYQAQIHHFEKYDITIVRGLIDSILVTSPDLIWAKRITIGTDRQAVEKALVPSPVVNEADSSQYPVCSETGDVYVIFHYYKNEVESIELVVDRP